MTSHFVSVSVWPCLWFCSHFINCQRCCRQQLSRRLAVTSAAWFHIPRSLSNTDNDCPRGPRLQWWWWMLVLFYIAAIRALFLCFLWHIFKGFYSHIVITYWLSDLVIKRHTRNLLLSHSKPPTHNTMQTVMPVSSHLITVLACSITFILHYTKSLCKYSCVIFVVWFQNPRPLHTVTQRVIYLIHNRNFLQWSQLQVTYETRFRGSIIWNATGDHMMKLTEDVTTAGHSMKLTTEVTTAGHSMKLTTEVTTAGHSMKLTTKVTSVGHIWNSL